MCLILLAWRAHPVYSLVVAANRDEFNRRRAAALGVWDSDPEIIAGRDLSAGGTWLGITRDGRFAAVTNVRESRRAVRGASSRGELVANFLASQGNPASALATVEGDRYNGFNLLAADRDELWWLSNRGGGPRPVEPGLHGLSNALLDTPWPKVTGGIADFTGVLEADVGDTAPDEYFAVLADRRRAPDVELPKTGVPPRIERAVSARFVETAGYGTRVTTVLRIRHDGAFDISERSFRRRNVVTATIAGQLLTGRQ